MRLKKNCHSDPAKGGRSIPCVQKLTLQRGVFGEGVLLSGDSFPQVRDCASFRMTIVLLCFGVILLLCSTPLLLYPQDKATSDTLRYGADTIIPEIDYYTKEHFRFENYIYKDNIKTAILHKEGWQLSSPVIKLNSNEKVKLSFDDLDAESKNYYYTIIHCNADWEPFRDA